MAVFKFRNLSTGQATPIPPGQFSVGRADDAYVHVEDGSVSRSHAQIFNLDEGFFIEDSGSANGTATGGAFITGRTQLNFGDVVHIGSVPFRIDPEIVGEPGDVAPSAGMRTARKSTMRHDTEKIPAIGEAPRVVETLSPERLVAPQIDVTKDQDAEELNAITIREPEPEPFEPMRLPSVRPGLTPLPQNKPVQRQEPIRAPQTLPPRPRTEVAEIGPPSVRFNQTTLPTPVQKSEASLPEQVTPVESVTGMSWGWRLVIFLAGLGTGLLLGLIFAKLFIDLGGKAPSLP